MKLWLFLALLPAVWAQNPNPCSQIRNTAVSGQVLSAINSGPTPPCQWISAGGGGSGSVTSIATSNGITGGPITTTGTISGINAAADGTTKGVSAYTAADFNATTGVISLDYTNGQKASAVVPGFLSSADWTTFNAKQAAGNYITALTGDVTASGPGSAAATIANNAVTAVKMVNAGVFTGDVTTTFPAITVAKVNGIAYSATGAAHSVPVITTANTTATYKAVPDCTDTGGNHLNFTQSTDAFSCGTSGGSTGITIGTTTITSGTTTRVLYDNGGVVGEYTTIPVALGGTNLTTTLSQVVYCADATGSTTTYTCTGSPAPPSLVTGMRVSFVPQAANTGASTLAVNGLGAIALKAGNASSSALVADDLLAGKTYELVYDGTNFLVVNGPDGTWTGMSYSNSWTDFGSSYQVGQYRKLRNGTVEVRGVWKNGTTTAGTTTATLPAGYRPATKMAFAVGATNAAATGYILSQMDVMTSGTVVQQSNTALFAATSAWIVNFTFSVY